MIEFRDWLFFERQLCLTVDKGTSIVILENKKSMEEADNMASFCILDEFEVHKNKKFLEIAEELNISSKTVDYRIQQALKQLRKELKDYLPLLLFFFAPK